MSIGEARITTGRAAAFLALTRETAQGRIVERSRLQAAGALFLALLLTYSCRSASPPPTDEPLIAGPSLPDSRSVRAMMRVRASRGEAAQSFRAQLLVQPSAGRMLLTAYTPVGTAAATLYAEGDGAVFLDHVNRTAWEGSASELAESIDLFGRSPALWAAAVVGVGTLAGADLVREPAPPALPERVTITSGAAKAEIVLSALTSTAEVPRRPAIPRGYRCCVAPRM